MHITIIHIITRIISTWISILSIQIILRACFGTGFEFRCPLFSMALLYILRYHLPATEKMVGTHFHCTRSNGEAAMSGVQFCVFPKVIIANNLSRSLPRRREMSCATCFYLLPISLPTSPPIHGLTLDAPWWARAFSSKLDILPTFKVLP